MTCELHFLPDVEDDVIAGFAWYDEKSPGLGDEFLRMFYASAHELSRNALLYPKKYGDFRRRLLRRFPYAIYYRVEENEIIVFGLFHCARDTRTIRLNLSDRDF